LRVSKLEPPRTFTVGRTGRSLQEVARIELAPSEQITLVTDDRMEYDVVATDFGFYATPSLNWRLPAQGLRPALIKNDESRYYVVLVRSTKLPEFEDYCRAEGEKLVCWLDNNIVLGLIAQAMDAAAGD
jgi:hypothetical protein